LLGFQGKLEVSIWLEMSKMNNIRDDNMGLARRAGPHACKNNAGWARIVNCRPALAWSALDYSPRWLAHKPT